MKLNKADFSFHLRVTSDWYVQVHSYLTGSLEVGQLEAGKWETPLTTWWLEGPSISLEAMVVQSVQVYDTGNLEVESYSAGKVDLSPVTGDARFLGAVNEVTGAWLPEIVYNA